MRPGHVEAPLIGVRCPIQRARGKIRITIQFKGSLREPGQVIRIISQSIDLRQLATGYAILGSAISRGIS
ncbi:MAG: hypothetical protein QF661_12390 [Arenicellales bacterium]|nr:hypothetical protein [Arenicellales bacterium]